jgi:hypothetical protein
MTARQAFVRYVVPAAQGRRVTVGQRRIVGDPAREYATLSTGRGRALALVEGDLDLPDLLDPRRRGAGASVSIPADARFTLGRRVYVANHSHPLERPTGGLLHSLLAHVDSGSPRRRIRQSWNDDETLQRGLALEDLFPFTSGLSGQPSHPFFAGLPSYQDVFRHARLPKALQAQDLLAVPARIAVARGAGRVLYNVGRRRGHPFVWRVHSPEFVGPAGPSSEPIHRRVRLQPMAAVGDELIEVGPSFQVSYLKLFDRHIVDVTERLNLEEASRKLYRAQFPGTSNP